MASQVEQIKWVPGTRFTVDGFRFQVCLALAPLLRAWQPVAGMAVCRSICWPESAAPGAQT